MIRTYLPDTSSTIMYASPALEVHNTARTNLLRKTKIFPRRDGSAPPHTFENKLNWNLRTEL